MAVATTFGESGDAEAAIRVRVRWLMCNETPRFVGVTTEVSFRGSERCAVAHCGCAWAFLCDTPVLWLNEQLRHVCRIEWLRRTWFRGSAYQHHRTISVCHGVPQSTRHVAVVDLGWRPRVPHPVAPESRAISSDAMNHSAN